MDLQEDAELALRRQYAAMSSLTDVLNHLEREGRLVRQDVSESGTTQLLTALTAALVESHILTIMSHQQLIRALGTPQPEMHDDKFRPEIMINTIRTYCRRHPELAQWNEEPQPEESPMTAMTNATADRKTVAKTVIRELRDADLKELSRIFGDAHRAAASNLPAPLYAAMEGSIQQELRQSVSSAMRFAIQPNHAIVATREDDTDRMTGFAALCHVDDDTTELKNVVVDPNEQGTGTGTLLMEAVEERARTTGYHKIVLWTYRHLDAAIRLYYRRGYRENEGLAPQGMDQELEPVFMSLQL